MSHVPSYSIKQVQVQVSSKAAMNNAVLQSQQT